MNLYSGVHLDVNGFGFSNAACLMHAEKEAERHLQIVVSPAVGMDVFRNVQISPFDAESRELATMGHGTRWV